MQNIMDKYKFAKENFRHNFSVTFLLVVVSVQCVVVQALLTSNVSFSMEPVSTCLNFYSMPLPPPVFYCKVEGLKVGMQVLWLRNDAIIGPEDYDNGDFVLMENLAERIYELKIQRKITWNDDRSRYTCAVYRVTNSSDQSEWTLLKHSHVAKLKVNFYVPERKYPECSIRVAQPSSPSSSSAKVTAYEDGRGFTIVCCSEIVHPELSLVWQRGNNKGMVELARLNTSRESAKDQNVCLTLDVTDHQSEYTYSCHLTIARAPIRTECRKKFQASNDTIWHEKQERTCSFRDRGINLLQQNTASVENDAAFTCYSKGAIKFLWQFSPRLDRNKNQYHLSDDGASVLLNLDSLSHMQYNITCVAVGENSIGSRSLIIEISPSDSRVQSIRIVAITLGVLVVLVMILLILYAVKTRLLDRSKNDHIRGLTPQEMRARIQIRRNVAGNSGGIYTFPSSRMASSSITPLMEGPEEMVTTVEHERPPSPRPPRPGMMRPGSHLPVQGAVGGIILDEEEMVECEYRDESEEEEFEFDPKKMNVEGLQYADLEFSEDEDDIKDTVEDDSESGDDERNKKSNGAPPVGKPKIDYANIVHFDPRRNSEPRRDSDSRWSTADPWKKNTNI
ncbi:uncharacterized protein LOC110974620 [Acanthaster planci]|uniref:Uncharacterized protein LOC110974620 n=1 Tax=Acanthaster planci TaxID=133434 RepID=A0A8B7XMQ9_ACAPL|nr:uncharacterized protein LOC110974620 [Acanthaster planci]